jgi:two-component system copper resistance phosphate regulon response regulator CusR
VLRVADLEIDRLTQQVRRAPPHRAHGQGYALLEYLAANPGRVFSRTMIIEHVWDQSFEGLTNIVDVYVRHRRSKVDEPFAVKLIRTVRGVGYGLTDGAEP